VSSHGKAPSALGALPLVSGLESSFHSTDRTRLGSESTPDLHLRDSGQYASNAGLDLSADFSRDIDDAVRTDTWDMGADEGVTGTILLDPKVLTWREIEPQ